MEILNNKRFVLVLVLIIIILSFTYAAWRECTTLKDFLKLSSVNIPLHIQALVHNDRGINPFIVRVFHNKVVDFSVILLRKYLLFFDIRLGINLFSIIGYIGLVSSIYYLFISWKNTPFGFRLYASFAFIFPILYILFEFPIPLHHQILMFYAVYSGLIVYGLLHIIKSSKWRVGVILVLAVFSLWWLYAMKSEVANYCVGIISGLQ